MRRALFTILLVIVVATSFAGAEPQQEIKAATKAYAGTNGVVGDFTVLVEQISGNYARVKVVPQRAGETDPAWVFLKNEKGGWRGLTLGTGFGPEDYKRFDIPSVLWLQ